MKLSTALRYTAQVALEGGNRWISYGDEMYWRAKVTFCYQVAGSIIHLTTMSENEICLMFLLLAEIAEGDGR